MVQIKNNVIRMTRGDTLLLRVRVTVGGVPYVPMEGDSVRFALKRDDMDYYKKQFKDAAPLVVRDIPTDTMLLRLEPEDTKGLDFGDYVYDVQLTFASGFVRTVIADTKITLCREVD